MTRTRVWGCVRTASWAAGFLSLVAVGGCQASGNPSDDRPPAAAPAPRVVGPARDVQLIAQRAVLGFRDDGGALRAGYATHEVTVRGGVAELTPYHYAATGERITGGTIGIETGAITRADGTILGGTARARTDGAGAVAIARGEATEVLTNREDGIQQAWRFAAAPAGSGELTVEVQITGQRFARDTGTGLHFRSSAGLGFRYGHALWLDAAGHEWPIQAAWHDGHVAITVPGGIVTGTAFPAALELTATAEVDVDTPVVGSVANSMSPAVAFDGTNYLVVWADQRLSRDEDIFATRVSPAGAILDAMGITIAAAAGRQVNPTVAFAGTRYVVAWEDGKVAGGTEFDIAAALVSPSGVVTQLGAVAASPENETGPKLAGNGTSALLVFSHADDIRAALFSGGGFGGAIDITADAAIQGSPTVAAQPGANYLVVYAEGPTTTADLRGAFVTPGGAISGAAFTISAGAGRQYDPAAAFDGTSYVVVWTNNSLGINLFGTRVSPAGVVLDTRTEGTMPNVGGVSISSVPNSNQELEDLACVAGVCLVLWQDNRNLATTGFDIYAQRLTTSPALANSGPEIVVSNILRPQFTPALVANATGFFGVWQDNRDNNTQTVFGARLTAAGDVVDTDGIMLVTGNNRETAPAMGRAGPNTGPTFGVFWTDSRTYGSDIALTRFSGLSKLDATARIVAGGKFAQASPAVTMSTGTSFFAVWQDTSQGGDRDIFGARIDTAGNVLAPGNLPISTAAGDQLVPRIATNGTVSLVAWEDRRNGNIDIFGAVVNNTSGAVLVRDLVICNAAGDQSRPAIGFDQLSGQFLVVWSDGRIVGDNNVFGARVTAAGAVLDPNGAPISTAPGGQFAPRVSFLLGTGLVVWEDRRLDNQGDIFGARVKLGPSLLVSDPAGLAVSGAVAGTQNLPTVAAVASSFLVAWVDGRNAAVTGTDIFGQLVTTAGALTGKPVAISTDVEDEDVPQLSDSTTSPTRIAYTRVRPDLQTIRVETRSITVP
jgi:hypothetical protein